ncbi:CYTH domain-containing protein [Salinibius halmophilus]|uniref:CYTH domain-containing protein n=1 Tax=Salinibius halmophilus TaxID=1853216 RepID=UPI000E670C8D|nr:CYTH domain-containing protein [Salinibius halmophilus]
MAKEIELKLSAVSVDSSAIIDWCQKQFADPIISQLANAYFDTPDQALSQQKVALRIRSYDGSHTMTLKTAGEAAGGLHQRNEYDWPLVKPELDVAELTDKLPNIDWQQVQPQFTTNFKRYAWLISFQHSEIELVMDVGGVEANNQVDAINEIELELKSGLASELYDLATRLCRQFALLPNNVSKAQRGYRLLSGDDSLAPCAEESVAAQLNHFTNALESFSYSSKLAAWQQAAISLANLRMLSITKATSLQGDCIELLKLCQPILSILPATIAEQSKLAQVKNQHQRLLATPALGQTLISIAQGLYDED